MEIYAHDSHWRTDRPGKNSFGGRPTPGVERPRWLSATSGSSEPAPLASSCRTEKGGSRLATQPSPSTPCPVTGSIERSPQAEQVRKPCCLWGPASKPRWSASARTKKRPLRATSRPARNTIGRNHGGPRLLSGGEGRTLENRRRPDSSHRRSVLQKSPEITSGFSALVLCLALGCAGSEADRGRYRAEAFTGSNSLRYFGIQRLDVEANFCLRLVAREGSPCGASSEIELTLPSGWCLLYIARTQARFGHEVDACDTTFPPITASRVDAVQALGKVRFREKADGCTLSLGARFLFGDGVSQSLESGWIPLVGC